MSLHRSMVAQGLQLFKYRGQIPVLLFIMAIPVIYFSDYGTQPNWYLKLMNGCSVLCVIAGFAVRAFTIGTTPKGTSGRNTKEQVAESLNTLGIYSVVRHPLYLGNYLMWIGLIFYCKNIGFVLLVTTMYWLYYERIMMAEEDFIGKKFGKFYDEWSSGVPAFFPKFSNYRAGNVPFSMKSVLRREYSGFLATVVGYAFIDWFIRYFHCGKVLPRNIMVWALGVSVIITVVLKLLKKQTKILEESDRS
jgi:protein-S-isoprenylcysteine O-methyltransferase Ste14